MYNVHWHDHANAHHDDVLMMMAMLMTQPFNDTEHLHEDVG